MRVLSRAAYLGPTVVLAFAVQVLACPAVAHAGPPALPSSFWGNVSLADGTDLPVGLVVRARVGGVVSVEGLTRSFEGHTVYALHVPAYLEDEGSPRGGRDGDVVRWDVCGHSVSATGTWRGGTNQRLDLLLPTGTDCVVGTGRRAIEVAAAEKVPQTVSSPTYPTVEPTTDDGAAAAPTTQAPRMGLAVGGLVGVGGLGVIAWRRARRRL